MIGCNRHVPVQQVLWPDFVGSKPRIADEQDQIMQLLGVPFILRLGRIAGILAAGFVEKLVLFWTEPRAVNNLRLKIVRRREVRKMLQPTAASRRFQH